MLILWLGLLATLVQSLQISYCSPDNTGDANGANWWQFQSNGHCQDTCKYQYAYAVLQGNNCWCSNYAPYDQIDNGNCNVQCPGYPSEQCGNQAQALYGYYHLTIDPSGTLTPASTTTTSQTTTSSNSASTSRQSMTRGTPTPLVIVSTVFGSITTVLVTPTLPPDVPQTASPTVSPSSQSDSFWSSTPKVAGTFTAVAIVAVLLIAGIVFFFWRRHRSSDSVAIQSVSDRGDNYQSGAFNDRRNSQLVLGGRGGSNGRQSGPNTPMSMTRRQSGATMIHDQRLNPNALYNMGQDNGSHVSFGSLHDDRDYTRPVQNRELRVHNPDAD